MRLALLVVVSGCGFQPSTGQPVDAENHVVDVAPDMSSSVTWDIDLASGRAVPRSAMQWSDLIANKGLSISAPNGLWLMQEASGSLQPAIGSVVLSSSNATAANYQRIVPGWTRTALATAAGQSTSFTNTSSSELPDVSITSMTILLYYATPTPPTQQSSIVFGGSGIAYGEVSLDAANHYKLTANATNSTGTVVHGDSVVPVILKLDVSHAQQVIYVNHEKISSVNSPLASSRGLLLAAADHVDPDGRWLYMATWYGTSAEMTDAQVSSLLTALGW